MPKTFKSLLAESSATDVVDTESMLQITKYISPKEYALLVQEYNAFVASVGSEYSFKNFLFDVVISDRIYEEQQLARLAGVKYYSQLQHSRSSESIDFYSDAE